APASSPALGPFSFGFRAVYIRCLQMKEAANRGGLNPQRQAAIGLLARTSSAQRDIRASCNRIAYMQLRGHRRIFGAADSRCSPSYFRTSGNWAVSCCNYVGELSLLWCHCTVADFIGPSASTLWTCSHLEHSKVRRSEPLGPGSIRASIMRP